MQTRKIKQYFPSPQTITSAAFLICGEKKGRLVEPYHFIFDLIFMLSPLRNLALVEQKAFFSNRKETMS